MNNHIAKSESMIGGGQRTPGDRTRALLAGLAVVIATQCIAPVASASTVEVEALSYEFCGRPLGENAFGRPVDYTNPADAEHVSGIEYNHLNRDVQSLTRGQTSDSPVDDLAYILRQVPNHPRALALIAQFEIRNGHQQGFSRHPVYTADCYFRRALTMTANNQVVHLLYAVYLHKTRDYDAALKEYLIAKEIGPANSELHYSLGLLYVDREEYEAARREAVIAYELGYPLSGLRARLQRLGKWENADEQ